MDKEYRYYFLMCMLVVLITGILVMPRTVDDTHKPLKVKEVVITPQPVIKWRRDTIKCIEINSGVFVATGKMTSSEKQSFFNHIRNWKYKNN